MSDINNVTLVGRMTRDPEARTTKGDQELCSFSIAVGKHVRKGDEYDEITSFFNCTAWGFTAKKVVERCKKGTLVAISGELQQRRWEAEDGSKREAVQVNVRQLQPLDKYKKRDGSGTPAETPAPSGERAPF